MGEEKINGESSGSDSAGSVGTGGGSASGSGASGSNRGIDGSGGNANGSDNGNANATASNGNDSGSDNISADSNIDIRSNKSVNRDSDNVRGTRAERDRGRRSVRLGDTNRDRDTVADNGSATRAGIGEERNSGNDNEPVIRLGANRQGRPRANVKTDEKPVNDFKLSQSKDVIKMFVDSIFEVPAAALKQDFWKLSKDESKTLTDAIIQWLESMPKSRQSRVALFINENLPLINLAMVAFFLVSERVRQSMQISQMAKQARGFGIAVETANQQQTTATKRAPVVTPMDSMFNN